MFFVNVSSWSRCSFKHPSIFVISFNSNCRPVGTCLHVNNSYLGCQPHLAKELLHVSPRGSASTCHFTVDRTWQSQLRSDRLTGPTPADTGREGGGAGREEWQHRCIINLFIILRYSPLIIPSPQKNTLPSPFPSPQMSSVGAWLRRCRSERIYFQPEFRFPSLLPVLCLQGQMNIHWTWTKQAGSCRALSHR